MSAAIKEESGNKTVGGFAVSFDDDRQSVNGVAETSSFEDSVDAMHGLFDLAEVLFKHLHRGIIRDEFSFEDASFGELSGFNSSRDRGKGLDQAIFSDWQSVNIKLRLSSHNHFGAHFGGFLQAKTQSGEIELYEVGFHVYDWSSKTT
jgi:hypothetical protein